jgi:hypothetical protein
MKGGRSKEMTNKENIQKIREAVARSIYEFRWPYGYFGNSFDDIAKQEAEWRKLHPNKPPMGITTKCYEQADQLLSELDKLRVVKLAKDQTPTPLKEENFHPIKDADYTEGFRDGQFDMQKAGFKRVVSIVTGTPKEG